MSESSESKETDFLADKRQRFLFVLLLLLVLFAPVLDEGLLGGTSVALLEIAVVLGGVYATSLTSKRLALGLLIAVPAVITSWGFLFQQSHRLDLARMASLLVIFVYCARTTLRWVFSVRRTGIEEVFGAVNSYILIALSFGLLYCIMERLLPGSFKLGPHDATTSAFTYYSFTTIETLGYGDISAIDPFARSLSVVEAMVGVFYIAALIGHLVGALPRGKKSVEPRVIHRSHVPVHHTPILPFWKCVILVIAFDSLIPILGSGLEMPFYFDTWGTMVGVMIGGLWAGVVGGALYSILAYFVSHGASSWIWSLCSIAVAFLTHFCFHRKYIDIHRPVHLLLSGIFIGSCTGILALFILQFIDLRLYDFETDLVRLIIRHFHYPFLAHAMGQLALDWMDKALSICVAAIVIFTIHEFRLVKIEDADG